MVVVGEAAKAKRVPASLRRNITASLAGQISSAAIQLLFIPIYLRLLGIESYALIGFYATLQATLQILDLGLSPTMNRELARYSAFGKIAEARDFVWTLQVFYWAIGIALGIGLWIAAPFVATKWVHASATPPEVLISAVRLMGILSVLQWPLSFYTGGLTGLQQQPIVNAIRFLITVIANVGAAIVLYWFSRTIVAFFAWQIVVNALYVLILTALLWRRLSGVNPSEFRLSVLRDVWRFAIGMTGIGASALLLTQLDKIILVKILPLREFGYYVLATTLSAGLYLIISSIFNGIFPRFATLAARGEEEKLRILYREATQLMAVAILPLAAVMALHAHTIVLAWTGDTVAAAKAAPIIAILVLGTALNGLMNLPYALQLAYGWTRLGLSINLALVILLVPAILFVAPRYGAVGGASVWLVLNLIYMAIAVPMTHRRLLRGETFRWFCRDIIPVALGAFATSSVIRIFSPLSPSRGEAFAFAALAVVASFLGGMCFSPIARRWLV